MEEIFVVQKRPVTGDSREDFYFRIVDTRTGERLIQTYLDEHRAKEQCQRLNASATRDLGTASRMHVD